MKKSLFLLPLLALLASCADDGLLPQPSDTIKSITITAKDIVLDEPATRTTLAVGQSGLEFTWAESDVVGIFPNTGDQVSFPMTAGAGTQSANFDGGGWAVKSSSSYAAYFPFSMDNYGQPYTALPFSYEGQMLASNGSTADMGDYDYMVAKASAPSDGNISFQFDHINSFLWLQLTSPVNAQFTGLTLSADEEVFASEATIDIATGVITPTVTSTSMTLAMRAISVEADGRLDAWMVVAPVDLLGKTLTATLTTTDGDVYEADIAGKTLATGRAYILSGTLAYAGTEGDEEGRSYVDLGLTSGTLWATCNVGADKPEGYGDLFAWGETESKNSYSYDWAHYTWCQGSNTTFTKYCNSERNGIVDNRTTLDFADDAAFTHWGSNWRMPTQTEMDELKTECTWTWTTQHGVNGYRVTGPNGKSIFLPAAGMCFGDMGMGDIGTGGAYWTSSLFIYSISDLGYDVSSFLWFTMDNGILTIDFCTKYAGCSVRPVYDETPKHDCVDLGLTSGTRWATCNVGADTPEGYGDFYAWGETWPKDNFTWSNYDWCNGTETSLTKYNDLSGMGTVDNKYTLDAEDDVASVQWGSQWRMPTKDEFDELTDECTWMWTTQNGVNGSVVTGPNGQSIFLPAVGMSENGEVGLVGSAGFYWTSTLFELINYSTSSSSAWCIDIALDNKNVRPNCGIVTGALHRYCGVAVRPVRAE